MVGRKHGKVGRHGAAMALAFALGVGSASAQAAPDQAASDQDKHFLDDTVKDSNYEIKTGQLALGKSQSDDVKAYAEMVIHDHTALKQQVKAADAKAQVKPTDEGSMSLSDDASYAKLKLLTGDAFDKAYIQGLIKGNKQSLKDGKAEAASTSVPVIKALAQHRVALDTKHTEKAGQLAIAHHVPAGS